MALPATGDTITMSDIRNFFVSEGEVSTYVLGILGTYIGISQGTTITMSSTFGGYQSATSSFSNAKNYQLGNLRAQSGPPDLQELGGKRHFTTNQGIATQIFPSPDGNKLYFTTTLNGSGGGQLNLNSPWTLGGASEATSFKHNTTAFSGWRGLNWNSAGTTCIMFRSAGNGLLKVTSTNFDLNSYSGTSTRAYSDFKSFARIDYAQWEPSQNKFWLLGRDDVVNGFQYIYQFSYTGSDPVSGTVTYDGRFDRPQSAGNDYPDWFQVTEDYLFVGDYTQGGSLILRYELGTSWDLVDNAPTVRESDHTSGIAGWSRHLDSTGTKVIMGHIQYGHAALLYELTTPFDFSSEDLSSLDYTGGGDFWYPLLGQTTGAVYQPSNYYDYLPHLDRNGGLLYADYKYGQKVGAYAGTGNNIAAQVNMTQGWNLNTVSSTHTRDISSYLASSFTFPGPVFADFMDKSTSRQQTYITYLNGSGPEIHMNVSAAGGIADNTLNGRSSALKSGNTGDIYALGAAHSLETSHNLDDVNNSYYWMTGTDGYLHQWRASATLNNVTPSMYNVYSSVELRPKLIGAGFDPEGVVFGITYSANAITGIHVRHLTNSLTPNYAEFILYCPGANTFGQFTCNSMDLVGGTWTLQRSLRLPREISVAGFQLDGVGENMWVLSWTGILYHLTFDD